MENYVPYALAAIGAFEGHIITTKFIGANYTGMGAALGAHFYVLSADDWIRLHGVGMTYVWLALTVAWLLAQEYL